MSRIVFFLLIFTSIFVGRWLNRRTKKDGQGCHRGRLGFTSKHVIILVVIVTERGPQPSNIKNQHGEINFFWEDVPKKRYLYIYIELHHLAEAHPNHLQFIVCFCDKHVFFFGHKQLHHPRVAYFFGTKQIRSVQITAIAPENRPLAPKGKKNRLSTTHFSEGEHVSFREGISCK